MPYSISMKRWKNSQSTFGEGLLGRSTWRSGAWWCSFICRRTDWTAFFSL